jgi:RNA polymerase sigma-70 factor (ECF subfamily)
MSAHFDTTHFQDEVFITDLRSQMLKFATLQLRDTNQAEDAVQEALISAFKNCKSFNGKSAFKTWVFAILKNKVVDIIRGKSRYVAISELQGDSDEQEDFSVLFDKTGHWKTEHKPSNWGDPENCFENEQFWLIFESCLNKLPSHHAQPFMMREFIGLESAEICKELALSTSNLHVVLYRARMGLQKCLEKNWFKGAGHV